MSLLNVLYFPDPRLRIKAEPVAEVDGEIQQLVDDMFETMYQAPGIGLAAVQVDVSKQVIVIDITEDKTQPLCFINPILRRTEGKEKMEEGCLSVPGIFEQVTRYNEITVDALDREGKQFTMDADGLLSVCIQHEMDHLQGKLFVDYLSEMKRKRIRKKLDKNKRHTM